MKNSLKIFGLLFISNVAIAQRDSSYVKGCRKITIKQINNIRIQKRIVDTCFNMSSVVEYSKSNFDFEEDGISWLFWDKNFNNLKVSSFIYKNHPIGIWQEYFKNGVLLCEGSYEAFNITLASLSHKQKADTFIIVKCRNPLDTFKVPYNRRTYDSINSLITYSDMYNKDSVFNLDKKAISGFPGVISVKVGEWKYYSESSKLIRREYYNEGMLIKYSQY